MTDSTLESTGEFICRLSREQATLSVVWHAGEPLALPVSFYENAFTLLADMEIEHHFQTNATLITNQWCDLFKRWDVRIGVSIDGPAPVHDGRRIYRNKRGSFNSVERGIQQLKKNGVPFTTISVISAESLESPNEVFEYLFRFGAESIAFNIEETEGINISSLIGDASIVQKVSAFYELLWEYAANVPAVKVRELSAMKRRLTAPVGSVVARACNMPGAVVNIDVNGNISTFSPELLGISDSYYGCISWLNVHSLTTNGASMERYQRASDDIASGVQACRRTCEYFSVCGGGDPSNKLAEHGTFTATETMHCKLHMKVLADVVMSRVEQELGIEQLPAMQQGERH